MLLVVAGPVAADREPDVGKLYRNKHEGKDPSFTRLLDTGYLPKGKNSTKGVQGTRVIVNHKLVETTAKARRPIPRDIKIHTVGNSHIKRDQFGRWSRWYQEDGSTQVFRMFEGEHNVRNSRPDAGRIESYSSLQWKRGAWHTWEGTYTIIKPHGAMIFQAKNSDNEWGVSIAMGDTGDIKLNHRRGQKDAIIAKEMVGKPFVLKVRDNGHDYEVFLDGKKVGEGHYNRPTGTTRFRWGMYGKTFRHDAMLFVSGVAYD